MSHVLSWMAAAALLAAAGDAAAQCTSDAECPTGSVCRGEGSCFRPVAPGPPGSSSPPAPAPAAVGENTAQACRNGVDDDRDGHFDCADQDCGVFVFCAQSAGAHPGFGPGAPAPGSPAPGDPPGPRRKKGIAGLYIGGPIVFGVAWGATVVATAAIADGESDESAKALAYSVIPVAGPFLMLGSTAIDTRGLEPPLVVSGVLQGSGLLLTLLGLVIRRPVTSVALGGRSAVALSLSPASVGATGTGVRLAIGGL